MREVSYAIQAHRTSVVRWFKNGSLEGSRKTNTPRDLGNWITTERSLVAYMVDLHWPQEKREAVITRLRAVRQYPGLADGSTPER